MPVVTIRGQMGSGASEIGKTVAEKLHIDYVDREIIAAVASKLKIQKQGIADKETPASTFMGRVAEAVARLGEYQSAAYAPASEIPLDDAHYLSGLESIIKELAGSRAVVIRGRGSQFILKNQPGILHVLVVSPLELRVKRVMENMQLDAEAAKKEISRVDGSRREFIKKYFQAELEDPINYDLVINTADINFNDGVAIILDALRAKVRVLPDAFQTQWGTPGKGGGQFDHPKGIAVDSFGQLYVVDSGNQRVQIFTASGEFISQWGKEGTGEGEFKNPSGICLDALSNIYVADFNNNRIQKFTSKGIFITAWGAEGSGEGQFKGPVDVAVDASGKIYVADHYNHRVQRFADSGAFISQWGTQGSGLRQFEYPSALAIDSSSNVYVADLNNNRIQKFTDTGGFISQWGSQGSAEGQFNGLHGIAINQMGEVYVADYNNHRVQKFTSSGRLITSWGSQGSVDGQFKNPFSVATDNSGNIYVTDYNNHRVQVFRPQALRIPR